MTGSPYRRFKEKLCTFAQGQAGIRNPFVIVAVDPAVEHRSAERLYAWARGADELPVIDDGISVQPIWLDELLPQTTVYNLCVALGGETSPTRIEGTMQDRLAEELVEAMVTTEIAAANLERQSHVVLLLNLGSLYPFTRASELLDELDRRNVRSTIGIPFPGDVVGGKLSFFGGDSRHYYPAHQIDGKIREVHLQQ
ncbi:BREX protein BrxB domain-containing protein [Halalkalirubrum salinum]|uniref:BREX protein BrxB domain-containing protein n=1 Tax=Halalkalirubrum salinum TaxID=2563889 RepID=UPI0010FAFC22|nr:BREX protein BrxB domain-containing protein [Halalkalirubrum salinum]